MVNAFLSTLFLYNKHIFLRSISLFASILFTFIIFSLIASSIYHGSFLNVSRSWFAHLQRSSRLKSLPAVSTYSAFRSILLAVFSPRLRYHRISLRIDITSSMLCILIQYSFNCWSLSFFFPAVFSTHTSVFLTRFCFTQFLLRLSHNLIIILPFVHHLVYTKCCKLPRRACAFQVPQKQRNRIVECYHCISTCISIHLFAWPISAMTRYHYVACTYLFV